MSNVIQVPVAMLLEVFRTLPMAGALLYIMLVSPQVLSATDSALMPTFRLLLAKIISFTLVIVAPTPETLKRR